MVTPVYNSFFWKFNSGLLCLPQSYSLCSVSNLRWSSACILQNSMSLSRLLHFSSYSSSNSFRASFSSKCSQTAAPKFNSIHKNKLYIARPFPGIMACPAREFSASASHAKTGNFFSKIFRKRLTEGRLIRSGYNLYESISKNTDILHFFQVLSLEDTFFSWVKVIQLQVWLVSARLMAEGDEGKTARDALIKAMWDDIQARIKDLGVASASKKTDVQEMVSHFQSALLSYDEGLLGSDKDLAGAVWRRLIRQDVRDYSYGAADQDGDHREGDGDDKGDDPDNETSLEHIVEPTADPRCLEAMVCYIRKQMQLLDSVERDALLVKGEVIWHKPDLPEHFS